MRQNVIIELYSPGLVIFDPEVLANFLADNNVLADNVFEVFVDDEELGRASVDQGVVCPIYEIPESKYSVFISEESAPLEGLPQPKFSYTGFPLKVESEIIIVADLSSLF